MKVGVVALQGAVSEHIDAVKRAFLEMELEGDVGIVRSKSGLESCQGLIIPGGESTTISRLLSHAFALFSSARESLLFRQRAVLQRREFTSFFSLPRFVCSV